MASEIRVNSLSSRTGLSTVTFTDTGPIFSGITTFQDNSGFNVGTGGSIFSPASNTVTLGTNSAERLRITSGGLVGIGTDNPTETLTLNHANGASIGLEYSGTENGTINVNSAAMYVRAGTGKHLIVGSNGTEKLRITSGGNIGVAGVTGTDYSLLDGMVINTANGSAGLLINSSSSSHNAYLGFSYGSGSSTSHADQYSAYIGRVGDNKLILGTNNTIRLNIDSSGRVGIQGDPTRALLEVRASGGSNTMLTALWGANEGTTTGALSDNTDKAVRMGIQHYDTDALPYAFLVGSSTSSANNLTFGGGTGLMNAATEIVFRTASNTTTTTGTERLRIDSSGDVQARRARSNTVGDVALSIQPSDSTIHYGLRIDSTNNSLNLDKASGTAANLLTINSSGQVSLGGEPASGAGLLNLKPSSGDEYLKIRDAGDFNASLNGVALDIRNSANSASKDLVVRSLNLVLWQNSSEKLRIDSSGRLLVGTTSSTGSHKLEVNGGTDNEPIKVVSSDAGAYVRFADDDTTGSTRLGAVDNDFKIDVNSAERMRIDSTGASTFRPDSYGIGVRSIAGSSSVNTAYFGAHSSTSISTGTITYEVYTNGNVKNTNNSYSQLSDVNLKENIVNATSQWDDIKSLQIRKYNFREATGYDTHTQIGLVAQEVETVCPGLVETTPVREDATPVLDADGNALETIKSVSTSVLYMKAVKALQEAMTRIESLETQNADLLARVTALEG